MFLRICKFREIIVPVPCHLSPVNDVISAFACTAIVIWQHMWTAIFSDTLLLFRLNIMDYGKQTLG